MKNVTITLDEDVARWARIKAAKLDTSLSRLLGDLLREEMLNEAVYQSAMARYLSKQPRPLSEPGKSYPTRDEIHAR